MKESVISVKNISKTFEKRKKTGKKFKDFFFPVKESFTAVDGVSFNIREGETFGLLGPNGAGKTTTIKMIVGLMTPTKGEIKIYGQSPDYSWDRIGLMLGYSMIYYRMSGYDNLRYFAKLYKVNNVEKKIAQLAKFFGLEDWLDINVENYSLGMKSKLSMARALIQEPDILLLDEPTLGLDPKISDSIRKMIKGMKKTIILTTHNMEEANQLCDRIAILNEGKIIKIDTPEKLKRLIEENIVIEIGWEHPIPKLEKRLKSLKYVHSLYQSKTGLRVILDNSDFLPKLMAELSHFDIDHFDEKEPTLFDVFVKLTK